MTSKFQRAFLLFILPACSLMVIITIKFESIKPICDSRDLAPVISQDRRAPRVKYGVNVSQHCRDNEMDHGCYCVHLQDSNQVLKYRRIDKTLFEKRNCERRPPAAIIPGSMKSGTSALKFYLSLHPELAFPRDELHILNRMKNPLEGYQEMMPYSTAQQTPIEKTAGYFLKVMYGRKLKAILPKTKIIIILRDPLKRAISNYVHLIYVNSTTPGGSHAVLTANESLYNILSTFEESVLNPDGSVREENRLVFSGLYAKLLRQWLELFPAHQFLVLDGEAFVVDPVPALQKVEQFLGIEPYFSSENFYFDANKGFMCLSSPFKLCMGKAKGREHPDIDITVRNKLQEYYRPHNKDLANLLETLNTKMSWTSF
ncbi:heparan sulfate glucosamine 3-O-sulfotransferase 1-like [Diadema antillarum]|uniref:heparan sulfate glucosamine 3-O-sulfotransferase 1-like n=1 Tax=Diadema antillarum TaxID=105358 RepID=UPI003A835962